MGWTTDNIVEDIRSERYRQIQHEGWSHSHDDKHDGGELAMAAGCYAFACAGASIRSQVDGLPLSWPWNKKWWKPTTKRRNLVKAAALIVAEIERLDRVEDHKSE